MTARTRLIVQWAVIALVVTASLLVAAAGDDGPETAADRSRDLAETIRCPTCRGQSVLESNAGSARAIRSEIDRRVAAGETDDEIRAYLVSVHGSDVLLNPPSSGFAGLIWVLPVVAIGGAAVGVGASVFRQSGRARRRASNDDRRMVEAALAATTAADSGGPDGGADDARS